MDRRNGIWLVAMLAYGASLRAAQESNDPCEGLRNQAWRSCLKEQASKPAEYDAPTREHRDRSDAYARRLAGQLADSAQARDKLLAAKLMQLPVYRQTEDGLAKEMPSQANALMREAQRLGRDDPLVQWVIGGSELAQTPPELKADAITQLRRLQPDNLAAWLLSTDAASTMDAAALARAAASRHHDMAYDERLVWYASTHLANLPEQGAPSGFPEIPDLDREQFALMQAVGLWLAGAMPSYLALSQTCKPDSAGYTAVTAEDCQRIARVLVEQSDTIIAVRVGLAIGERVARDANESERFRLQRRDLDWLAEQHGKRTAAQSMSEHLFDDLRERIGVPGMTELRHMREKVLAAGGTLQAPEGWVSDHERRRQAER